MIEQEELRLGNWVVQMGYDYNHDNKFHDPTGDEYVQIDIGILKNITEACGGYSAIPLTPEILGNAGFLYKEGLINLVPRPQMIYWKGYDKHRVFYLNVWSEGKLMFISQSKSLHVQYVHQLQNLFFAIVQQELEIKLPANVNVG